MWGCDCWLFGQSLVCHFLENSTPAFFSTLTVFLILHVSDEPWIPALVVHSVRKRRFSRTPHVSTDFESQADQDTSRAHLQQPQTSQIKLATVNSTRLERD